MAYRAAVVGGSGYAGAELLRLLAGHPEIEVGAGHRRLERGRRGRRPLSRRWPPAYARPRATSRSTPADLAGLDLVFCALPHGQSQAIAAELVDTVGHVVDLGADFRLPPADYEQWYGEAHTAPDLIDRFALRHARALPRRASRPHAHVAAPGCYPTAASLALAPLLAGGLVEPTGIVVDAVSGVSGAGRGLKTTSLFAEVNENVTAYGLLTHRHTAEMEQALAHVAGAAGAGAVHAAPRADDARHPRHLLRAARGGRARHRRAARAATATSTRDEPFVRRRRRAAGTKATLGSNAAHVTVRFDERTETVLAIGALDNLVKGASGQAIQAANLVLGLPETTGLPRRSGLDAVSVTAVPGFVAGGLASGIKESGAPDLAIVATDRPARRSPRPACSPPTSSRPRRCRSSRAHLADGRAAAVVLNSGNANAATGEPGRRDALPHVRAHRAGARLSRPTDVLVCSDRPHRHPDADGPGRVGHPEARRAARPPTPPAAPPRPRRCSPPTPCARTTAQPVELADGATATVGGMAKGAAMLAPAMATMLAVLTTDAAVDARRAAAALAADAVERQLQRARRRRVHEHQRHRARARQRRGRQRADHRRQRAARTTRSSRRSPPCAPTSRSRWPPTPRARPSCVTLTVRGARNRARGAARGARTVASSQLVQCSLYGEDPYWGRVLSELGVSGALFDPEQVDIAYNGIVVCRDGIAARARRRRGWRRRMDAARHRDRVRPAHRQRRGDDALHRPHARVRRREHGHVVSDVVDRGPRRPTSTAKAHDPRRGAAVHPRVLGQDRRDQVRRPRDGGPRARRPVRAGRRAHAPRRHEPGGRARRRPADHRPHAPARQGARVRRRPARHRRRDASTSCAWRSSARSTARSSPSLNQHGSYAVGLSGEDAGLITVEHARRAARLRRRRREHRPVDRRAAAPRGADPGDRHGRRRRRRPGLQRQRRHGRRRDRGGARRREARVPHRRRRASTPTAPTSRR